MDGQTWAFAEPFVNMKAEDLMRLLWTFVILLRAPRPLFLNFFKPGTYIVFQGKQIVQRWKFMVNIAQLSSLLLGKITKPLQIQITPETVTMSFSFQVSHGTWKRYILPCFFISGTESHPKKFSLGNRFSQNKSPMKVERRLWALTSTVRKPLFCRRKISSFSMPLARKIVYPFRFAISLKKVHSSLVSTLSSGYK